MSSTVVLISGANQGLGLETSKKLAREQSNYTILMGSRDPKKGEAAAQSISDFASGSSARAVVLDICSDESIASCVAEIEKVYGHLDVLINNAGIASAAVADDSLRKKYQTILETNVTSAVCLTEACVPLLKKASVPRVVFVSSGLGSLSYTVDPSGAFYGLDAHAYSASKAALNMVMATFSVKYGKEGFKVNADDPGYRATNLNGFSKAAGDPRDGAINACRLATLGKDGENGTFSNLDGPLDW